MSSKKPDKLTQLKATQRAAADKLLNAGVNQGPVDTPSEIRAQYYNPYVPIKSAGQINVQANNPGPIDSAPEIAASTPMPGPKDAAKEQLNKGAVNELKKTNEKPKEDNHQQEEDKENQNRFRPG